MHIWIINMVLNKLIKIVFFSLILIYISNKLIKTNLYNYMEKKIES